MRTWRWKRLQAHCRLIRVKEQSRRNVARAPPLRRVCALRKWGFAAFQPTGGVPLSALSSLVHCDRHFQSVPPNIKALHSCLIHFPQQWFFARHGREQPALAEAAATCELITSTSALRLPTSTTSNNFHLRPSSTTINPTHLTLIPHRTHTANMSTPEGDNDLQLVSSDNVVMSCSKCRVPLTNRTSPYSDCPFRAQGGRALDAHQEHDRGPGRPGKGSHPHHERTSCLLL